MPQTCALCPKQPTYLYDNNKYCGPCSKQFPGAISIRKGTPCRKKVTKRQVECVDCTKEYTYIWDNKRYCFEHAKPFPKAVHRKTGKLLETHPSLNKRPPKPLVKPRINVVCSHDDCSDTAHWGIKPKHYLFCKDHKSAEHIDLTHLSHYCSLDTCNKIMMYKLDGNSFCPEHAPDEALHRDDGRRRADVPRVPVRHGPCEHILDTGEQCGNPKAPFGYKHELHGTRCQAHYDTTRMIDMRIRKSYCVHEGCVFQYQYILNNEMFCTEHAPSASIHRIRNIPRSEIKVKGYRCGVCKTCGKTKNVYYNYKGQTKGDYCKQHQLENMINVNENICKSDNCLKRAWYGMQADPLPSYCRTCVPNEYMSEMYKKTCTFPGCTKSPSFGPTSDERLRCKQHSIEGDFNYQYKYCFFSGCENTACVFYEDTFYCKLHLHEFHPNHIICKTERTKILNRESTVADFLRAADYLVFEQHYIDYSCVDSIGIKNCRIDFVIVLDDRIVFLEVDEHQHKHANLSCEINRMFNSVGAISLNGNVYTQPIHFIRFNPDGFKHGRSKKVCPLKDRLDKLNEFLQNPPDMKRKLFGVTYMYYDTDFQGKLKILSSEQCPKDFSEWLI